VGTIDELFEVFALIQLGKIEEFPMVLVGTAYWKPLTDLLQRMVGDGAISAADLQLLFATDSVDEAVRRLEWNAINRFALKPRAHRGGSGSALPYHSPDGYVSAISPVCHNAERSSGSTALVSSKCST
jgi:hypothetical protein